MVLLHPGFLLTNLAHTLHTVYGDIPSYFLSSEVGYTPQNPLSNTHKRHQKRARNPVFNIFPPAAVAHFRVNCGTKGVSISQSKLFFSWFNLRPMDRLIILSPRPSRRL